MTPMIAFHEMEDVDHWLASKQRDEVFSSISATVRAFVDPENSNRLGSIAELPDLDALHAMLSSRSGDGLIVRHEVHLLERCRGQTSPRC